LDVIESKACVSVREGETGEAVLMPLAADEEEGELEHEPSGGSFIPAFIVFVELELEWIVEVFDSAVLTLEVELVLPADDFLRPLLCETKTMHSMPRSMHRRHGFSWSHEACDSRQCLHADRTRWRFGSEAL
jgi:hypothetical protein